MVIINHFLPQHLFNFLCTTPKKAWSLQKNGLKKVKTIIFDIILQTQVLVNKLKKKQLGPCKIKKNSIQHLCPRFAKTPNCAFLSYFEDFLLWSGNDLVLD